MKVYTIYNMCIIYECHYCINVFFLTSNSSCSFAILCFLHKVISIFAWADVNSFFTLFFFIAIMVFSSSLPSSMKRSATSMFALETLKERIVVNYSSEQLLDYITLIVKKENKQPHFCFFLGCLTNGLIHVCYQIYLHQLNKKGNLPFTTKKP